jgi:HEAT repeat protein
MEYKVMRPILVAIVCCGPVLTAAAAQQPAPAPAVRAFVQPPAATAPTALLTERPAGRGPAFLAREASLPQDPADSLWRAAREAVNRGDHARAASLYRQIRTNSRFARSEYRAASYYWEAYARHRIGTDSELRTALGVLRALKRNHPRYEGMAEANRLEATINGQLAQLGDDSSARAVRETASQAVTQSRQCDETQMYALEALLHMPSPEALPILKRVMERRDCEKLREKAVFIVSQKRGAETEEILLNAVRTDPSPEVRKQAVFWLSQVNSERAVDALDDVIRNSTDKQLLEAALFALSQHRGARATELLRALVTRRNTPPDVRKNAIFFLSQRRDPSVGPMLRNLYPETRDQETKEAILFALSQRREPENANFLFEIALNEREDLEVRKKALFFAGQMRALPVNRLGELYRTMPNVEMRKQILFTLSQSRDSEAVPQLIEIVRTERDTELQKNAIFWLGQSKDPRAVRFLGELLSR